MPSARVIVVRRLVAIAVLLLASCDERPPYTRAQAAAQADNLLLRSGISWGEPVEVLAPAEKGPDGHRWWQVRYRSPDGADRIVIVDHANGWARFPPADYAPRSPAQPALKQPGARLQPGPWLLLVTGMRPRPAEELAQLEIDAKELNGLAARTNLYPAFGVRSGRDGGVQLVYGWSGDGGTVRDEAVRDWLQRRTRFQESAWVELAPWP